MRTLRLALLTFALVLRGGDLKSGSNTCPSSGAKAVSATSNTTASFWTVQAPVGNTGKIYLGGASITTATGVALFAGDSLTAPTHGNTQPYNLNRTFFACTVNTDTITFVYQQ